MPLARRAVAEARSRRASPDRPDPASLRFLSLQPGLALGVERVQLRSVAPGHFGLDLVADLALQIGEVPVAFRELRQQLFVELGRASGLDRVDAVLLVGEAAQHDSPFALSL